MFTKLKHLEITIGISLFRYMLFLSFTPFIWRKLYVFVNNEKSYSRWKFKALFCGPLHIWTFDNKDLFSLTLDADFKGLSYIPKERYDSKRIL